MLGVIDETAKPKLPQIYLAKPNREIIGKLNYFIHAPHQHDFNLGSLNEISFDMPYMVENPYTHELERNPYIDLILERYLLKITLGTDEEWYIIDEIDDNMDHEKDIKTIHAYSLGFEIGDKLIRDYEVVSYTLEEVATDALRYTLWSVGEIDEKFKDKRRSFEVSEKTALAFLEEIAEKFGAFIEYDTVNRKVHFRDPAKIGSYRGLNINYGKYLKSLGKTSNADEMVTRLRVYGENGLSITRVNPTGTPYIEDFSYFMYPFEMDENGNVIKHSRYMSDELCKAIIRYDELVKSKEGVFASLIDEMEYWQLKLMEVESELFLAETELKIIQERLDIQRSYETFLYHEKTYNNKSETINFTLNRSSKYAIFARINNSNLSITINNVAVSIPQINEWKVLRKITEQDTVQIKINGTGTIQLYIVEITDEDFESTDENIINKYCEHKQQEIVNSIQSQWDNINAELTIVENEILDLKEELSIENNFSPELIQERNQFIIEKTWEDTSYFDDKELYEVAKEKFAELKKPKTSFDIDIINFMEVLEEQHNWNRLALGDDIRIQYDLMDINIQAKVIKISFNYQTKTIQLRIANVKEIEGKYTKLLDMLKSSYSTSTKVEMSKYKWDETTRKTNEVARLMEQEHDATQRRIIAGANETVTIDNRGITIRNPDFPNEIIRMNSGVLALSKSDGLNWETAITPNGVVAEKLYGNLIAGQNLKITNEKGSFVFDENGLNIKYNDLLVVDEDGQNKFEKIDDNIKALSEHVNKEIDDLNKSISDLDNYIENVFRDSIIQEAEAKTIQTYLMDLEKEKLDLDAKYNEIYNNPLLSGTTEKSQLNSSKNNYNSKFNNLVSVINNVIADGKVTKSERILVDTAFELYKQAIADLTVKLEQATNKIQFLLDEKINTKVDFEVYESKTSELTNDINGITANVSSLTTKINNNEVQIIDLQSNFNILADQISSKVEKNGVISAINQTAEQIKIQASKVDLSGYVTFTNLSTPGQTTIDGGNLKTGSITADKLNVTSLSAISANLGTVTAGSLTGVTLRSDDGEGNSVVVENGSIISKINNRDMVKIKNYNIYFYDSGKNDPTPDYSEAGQIGATWSIYNPEFRGLSVIGSKDYVSITRSLSETDFRVWARFDFKNRSTQIYGSDDETDTGRLYLYSTQKGGTANGRVPAIEIENFTDSNGTPWSGVFVYTGRDDSVPNDNNFRSGFEVWQYRGTRNGAAKQMLKIDTRSNGATYTGIFTDEAWLPRKTFIEDKNGSYYYPCLITISSNITDTHGNYDGPVTVYVGKANIPIKASENYTYRRINFSWTENIFFAIAQPYGGNAVFTNARIYNQSSTGFDLYLAWNSDAARRDLTIEVRFLVLLERSSA